LRAASPASQKLIDAFMRFRKLHQHHRPVGGLRQSEFWVLMTLKKTHEGTRQGVRVSELARNLDVATPTATQMVIRLEELGYVERRRSTKDRRMVHVVLTERGIEFIESVHQNFASRFDAVVEFLGEKDSNLLADLLGRVTGFLSASAQNQSDKGRAEHD